MIKLLADENLDNAIIRGLLRRNPDIDIVRVQDVGLSGEDDPTVLGWAAAEGCILLTHDVATITRHAYQRLAEKLSMPGVIEIPTNASIGRVHRRSFYDSGVWYARGSRWSNLLPSPVRRWQQY